MNYSEQDSVAVAHWAHNPKVLGSNPSLVILFFFDIIRLSFDNEGRFSCFQKKIHSLSLSFFFFFVIKLFFFCHFQKKKAFVGRDKKKQFYFLQKI